MLIRSALLTAFLLTVSFWFPAWLLAADQSPPGAEARWAEEGSEDVPEFRRHVVPLFSKLGCNMRSCHGSFQGQNGFRLSLFGFEPDLDRQELLEEDPESEGDGPRARISSAAESLVLLKPASEDEHGGGLRIKEGSWQYHLFKRWIEEGARFDPDKDSQLVRFELSPSELVFTDRAQPQAVRALAWFDDGSSEDVTGLTTFTCNDESVAVVDADGSVRVQRTGDTAIVAQYMGGVASAQVLVPAPAQDSTFPPFPAHNEIDRHVVTKLRKLNLHPSELCTDADFLRRVYLDVIGRLPSAEDAKSFLEDRDPEKRARLIDQLLDRSEYARYWGMKFSDWTGNSKYISQNPQQFNWLWQQWIEDKLERNVSYDEFVYGFICATSRDGRSQDEYLEEVDQVLHRLSGRYNYDDGTYARRRTNDLYWINVERRSPDNMVLQTANSFLGLRLECAQCHNHPFDRWTQKDFDGFKSLFMLVKYCDPETGEEKKGGSRGYGKEDVQPGVNSRFAGTLRKIPPKILGGPVVSYEDSAQDPRKALWEWMRAPDNAFFAPALVNRLWDHYFGVGIVAPADDFNLGNPPSNPQLLAWLAKDFIDHDFDLKHVHRTILNSRTYQLSWKPNDSNRLDDRNFSHARLRRLPAEVLMDAVADVTGVANDYGRLPSDQPQRAVGQASPPVRYSLNRAGYAMQIFGRPGREKTCDCERSNEPSVAQAMYLINDAEVLAKLDSSQGQLTRLLKNDQDTRSVIEHFYLAALSRYPSEDELVIQAEYVDQAPSRREGFRDVLWSLLNVREFVFNH